MQGNGNKGRYSFLVVRMRMKLDTIGKDPPHVEAYVAGVLVEASADTATNMPQVHWGGNDFRICCHELSTEIKDEWLLFTPCVVENSPTYLGMQQRYGPTKLGQQGHSTELLHERFQIIVFSIRDRSRWFR